MQYTLEQIYPKIFLLLTNDAYNLAMHFCRVQEYYENPVWRKKLFTMFDFMEWYANEKSDGSFTYPNDWVGFNVPGRVINKLYKLNNRNKIPDINKYDILMAKIVEQLNESENGTKWYLIGALEDDKRTIKHEIAHGLWATNQKYKKEMQKRIDNLSKEQYDCLRDWLLENMYCKEVIDDEIQAYLSTGLTDDMNTTLKRKRISYRTMKKPFTKVFKEFYNEG